MFLLKENNFPAPVVKLSTGKLTPIKKKSKRAILSDMGSSWCFREGHLFDFPCGFLNNGKGPYLRINGFRFRFSFFVLSIVESCLYPFEMSEVIFRFLFGFMRIDFAFS